MYQKVRSLWAQALREYKFMTNLYSLRLSYIINLVDYLFDKTDLSYVPYGEHKYINSWSKQIMKKSISQKEARENLSNPDLFSGGVYITKNGKSELFIQTAADREEENQERELEKQANALLKLVMLSQKDIKEERIMSPSEALRRLRDART